MGNHHLHQSPQPTSSAHASRCSSAPTHDSYPPERKNIFQPNYTQASISTPSKETPNHAAQKRQAKIPSKKPAKPVSAGGKRRPTLPATVNAAVAGPAMGPCACKTCSNVIAVETFAQRWVDEKGQPVKLEMAERVEISDILKLAPARVVKVQRIYNKALERRYMAKREELRRLGQGEQVLAFHSTAPWNIVPYLCSANSGADV
jgi:hypothetical protein